MSPSGNIACASWSAVEHAEDVGLVLARVDRAVQRAVDEPRVVAGADGVEAQRQRAVEHGGELDLLVAAEARVGGAAGGVLGDEVVHDLRAEPRRHVPDVEGDAEHVGGPAGVAGVLERAAATGAVAERLRRLATARGGRRSRRGRRRRRAPPPPRSRRRRTSRRAPASASPGYGRPASRARSTTGPIASTNASTSAWVEEWPRVSRSDDARALLVCSPWRAARGSAGRRRREHADPVEHSMPRASSSISSESPSQPGNDKCALPGSRNWPPRPEVAVDQRRPAPGEGPAHQVVAQRRRAARPARAAP